MDLKPDPKISVTCKVAFGPLKGCLY